ncbi:PAAR-like domain-containing protein [uncultured Shimia sp.]|uniref:PAAR-like domain-containing protein n=1 Tax=uncultured Shimia sp. TaxID=573152 RepID=UPI00261A9268|nr:PAAR-like domain-containing protein [uncultured Shimia sp.]
MTVFANSLEVSCKAQANKVIASFPDVCMTPPENPATPPGVPVPYPNFGSDGDTDKGTGSVKIGGKTVNQKNSSYFSKTTGDEAGCAAKKGVISSKNTGKAYSQAYSMNVKAEGKNVTRFSDIQTDNHGSPPNTPPWPKIGQPHVPGSPDPCESEKRKIAEACDGKTTDEVCKSTGLDKKVGERAKEIGTRDGYNTTISTADGDFKDNADVIEISNKAQKNDCLAALACQLPPYGGSGTNNCPCPGQTGHHMVPASAFYNKGRGENPKPDEKPLSIFSRLANPDWPPGKSAPPYAAADAPCVCAEGCSNTTGSHGMMHTEMSAFVSANSSSNSVGVITAQSPGRKTIQIQEMETCSYEDMRDEAIRSMDVVFPLSDCSPACLQAQLDSYHCDALGMPPSRQLRGERCGKSSKVESAAMAYTRERAQMLRGS